MNTWSSPVVVPSEAHKGMLNKVADTQAPKQLSPAFSKTGRLNVVADIQELKQ